MEVLVSLNHDFVLFQKTNKFKNVWIKDWLLKDNSHRLILIEFQEQ